MPSSIVRLTALDHERIERLVRRASSPGPSQDRWRDELAHLILAHLDAEHEALSPESLAPAGPATAGAVQDLAQLDAELRDLAEDLGRAAAAGDELPKLAAEVLRVLAVHAELLGKVLVPLEAVVARKEIRRLGGVYETARDQRLHELGEAEPPPRRLDLSRAELYELARKAGIEGRSSMSRRELIEELQRRSG